MKPLPVPPAARGGDARAQIAARAAFRHIFTRRGAHSTRFSRSLSLSIFPSLSLSLFPFPHYRSLSFLVHLSRAPSRPLSRAGPPSIIRRLAVGWSARRAAKNGCPVSSSCRHHHRHQRTSAAVVQPLWVIILFFMNLFFFVSPKSRPL